MPRYDDIRRAPTIAWPQSIQGGLVVFPGDAVAVVHDETHFPRAPRERCWKAVPSGRLVVSITTHCTHRGNVLKLREQGRKREARSESISDIPGMQDVRACSGTEGIADSSIKNSVRVGKDAYDMHVQYEV